MTETGLIRQKVLELVVSSSEGHIASSFSIVEMLLAISSDMQSKYVHFYPQNLILSKGHASYAYYALLNVLGLMSDAELKSVGKFGSKFYGHLPYIENDKRFSYGSGSLGHGLPYALGVAFANHISKDPREIYCIIGDGEANEGTFWESLLLIEKFSEIKLNVLIDCNGSSERAIPIAGKLKKLSMLLDIEVMECNGHDLDELQRILSLSSNIKLILCNTIKGYPSSLMINNPAWHHRVPSEAEMISILGELS